MSSFLFFFFVGTLAFFRIDRGHLETYFHFLFVLNGYKKQEATVHVHFTNFSL